MPDKQKKTQSQSKKSAESPILNKIEAALRESDHLGLVSSKETPSDSTQAGGTEKFQLKRKQRIVISSVIAVFVTLFGGGWLAYALYQEPNNVVTSAIAQTFSSKSFLTTGVASYGSQTQVKFDTQFSHKDGYGGSAEFSVGTTGDGENTKVIAEVTGKPSDDTYFRIKNLEAILDALLGPYASLSKSNQLLATLFDTYKKTFQPIINGIDNKWVQYGTSEIRKFDEARAVAFECAQDVLWGVDDDTGQLLELGLMYQNNRVVIVKESLGIVDGNLVYVVGVDKKAFKQFNKAFKTSRLYKDLRSCSKDIDKVFDTFQNDITTSKTSVQMWVDQWSHQLKRIYVENEEDEFSMDINFVFDKPVKITLPDESISYSKVADEVDSLMGILGLGSLLGK